MSPSVRRPLLTAELFRQHGPWIFALVSRIVPEAQLAEMVVVEVFWRVLYGPRASTLDVNTARVLLRVKARELAIGSLRSPMPPFAHDAGFRSECLHAVGELSQVTDALTTLAPHEREVFEFSYFEGLSHSEISEITGRSLGTVKTWARSSRLRIARLTASDQMQSEQPIENCDESQSAAASTR